MAKKSSWFGPLMIIGVPIAGAAAFIFTRTQSFKVTAGGNFTAPSPKNGKLSFELPAGARWNSAYQSLKGTQVALDPSGDTDLVVTSATAGVQFLLQWVDTTGGVQLSTITMQ